MNTHLKTLGILGGMALMSFGWHKLLNYDATLGLYVMGGLAASGLYLIIYNVLNTKIGK